MSVGRVSVEQYFARVLALWTFLDHERNLKIGWQPVGVYYWLGVFLTNLMSCSRPNQISQRHSCNPMGVVEYLGLAAQARACAYG
jgi:hypothetical protein